MSGDRDDMDVVDGLGSRPQGNVHLDILGAKRPAHEESTVDLSLDDNIDDR